MIQTVNFTDYQSLLNFDESLEQYEPPDNGGDDGTDDEDENSETSSSDDGNGFVSVGLPIIIVLIVLATAAGIFFRFCIEKVPLENGKSKYVIKESLRTCQCIQRLYPKKARKEDFSSVSEREKINPGADGIHDEEIADVHTKKQTK